MGRLCSESCGGSDFGDVFFVPTVLDELLGVVLLDGSVDFGRIAGDVSGKDAEGFEDEDGLEEEAFGLVFFGEAEFLGELVSGDDGELGIKAVLGGVSFQDKAHPGHQGRPFD